MLNTSLFGYISIRKKELLNAVFYHLCNSVIQIGVSLIKFASQTEQ